MDRMEIGYKIGREKIPGLAFADDVILSGSNRGEIERIYEALLMFSEYYGIKINQNKSAYTYNNTREEYDTLYFEGMPIKMLKKKESYKYLGIWINLTLDWGKMKEEIEAGYKRHLGILKRRRISTEQKIDIINVITMTKIGYRMNVIKFEEEFLQELDLKIVGLLKKSARIPKIASDNSFWLEVERGGRGLLRASDLQKATTISLILIQGLCTRNLTKSILEERLEYIKEKNPLLLSNKDYDIKKEKCDMLIKNLFDTCKEVGFKIKSYERPNVLLEEMVIGGNSFKNFKMKCKGKKI